MTVLNKRNLPPANPTRKRQYIGRGSRWGNPFIIGQHGNREEVIEAYRILLWQQVQQGLVSLEDLAELHDKDLVCYCAPLKCHGHVLESAALWASNKLEEERN